ncbi:hypothetical protein [Caenispirillum salinarum]|uniref:hypothetical protein n=1 Tax=Caenispirillum salinarum TaxID=859058 RepID=UPI00384D97F8
MPDLVAYYRSYEKKLEALDFPFEYADYDWLRLPESLDVNWMAYGMMAGEFSRELANSVNSLINYTQKLRAWDEVLTSTHANEKWDIVLEFVEPLALVALNFPYALRARFIFASAHLGHQANQARDNETWRDDLPPDEEIDFRSSDKYCIQWKTYKRLKITLEKLSSKNYRTETRDFRNRYNHRFCPHIEVGLDSLMTRDTSGGIIRYNFGGQNPLRVSEVNAALFKQIDIATEAFARFKDFVREHEVAISTYGASKNSAKNYPRT